MGEKLKKFVEKSNIKFNNSYSYEKFIYVNNLTKGIVTCPIHGDFVVNPQIHLSKSKFGGCHDCLKSKRALKYFDRCYEKALLCESRGEFQKKFNNEYGIAYRHGWLDEMCSHMVKLGNLYKRCIYVYEFVEIKTVYVGLTFNIKHRDKQHRDSINGSVLKFSLSKNIPIPKIKQLTDYIDFETASLLEGEILTKYEKNGWASLNKIKTGGLGGNKRDVNYDKTTCFEIASKYQTVSEFEKENYKLCQILRDNGWIKDAFKHKYDKHKLVCFTLDGSFYKIYDNLLDATKSLNLNKTGVSNCVLGKSNFCGQYQFMKWEDWIVKGKPNEISVVSVKPSNSKPVYQLDLNDNILNEFPSIADAVKMLNKTEQSQTTIIKACKGRLKTAYGFKWKYKE
jgi:hypothetical protein